MGVVAETCTRKKYHGKTSNKVGMFCRRNCAFFFFLRYASHDVMLWLCLDQGGGVEPSFTQDSAVHSQCALLFVQL